MRKNWNSEEKLRLEELIKKNKSIEQIAAELGRTETSVYLFCYRHNLALQPIVKKNLVKKMFEIRFGDAACFKPNRNFYEKTKIPQKRFQKIFAGYAQASNDELLSISQFINLSREEAFSLFNYRQGELFEDSEE